MQLNKQNVLFISRSTQHGGTENVIVQLAEILAPLVNKVVVCTAEGFDVKYLDKIGIKHYTIPDIQDKSPATIFKIILGIKRIVKMESITVIHSHHRMAAFYVEFLFGKNIVKIANAHNTFVDKRRLTHFAYRNTHLIAVGERVKENLVNDFGLPKDQVTVIHNAIKPFDGMVTSINEFSKAKSDGYTIIGNIGRLTKQKGMVYFIKAAAKVIEACPKTKFYIVGDGEERKALEQLVEDLIPQDKVMFMGYRGDIQNVMAQTDFIVLSSLWEGLPLTPIEAFSVGKPVVATDVDGTPEIVEDNKNGLLVKARDINGLVQAMIRLVCNKAERKQFGENAYKRYEEEFSLDKMAVRYVDYYKKL